MAFDVSPFVALVAIVITIWLISRVVAPRRREIVEDDPKQPYSIFTEEFDVVCAGRDLDQLLASTDTEHQFPRRTEITDPAKRGELAERAYRSACERFGVVQLGPKQNLGESVIAFLVDQSGSMANRMPILAGQLKAAAEELDRLGFATAILGFTTIGWRGGKARESWKQRGRPPRPGRLCALVHIVYKDFDAPLADEDWSALLRADALRENVDGEALQWAVGMLKNRKASRQILIALSDGAPVDDSTLAENGAGFLWRHLERVVADVANEGSVSLAAIGVEHSVDEVYPTAASVMNVDEVPDALQNLLKQVLA